jgi:hypothetical protein
MSDIKKDTIVKHIRILANLGCKFKVIEEDGTEHGELVVAQPKRQNAARAVVLKRIDYKTIIAGMKPGDVEVMVPPEGIELITLQGTVSAHCSLAYGAGKFTTSMNRKSNSLEVLKLED